MERMLRRALLLALCLGCGPEHSPYYSRIAIDNDLRVSFYEPVTAPPKAHSYYWRFDGASVSSVEYKSPTGERYDFLELVQGVLTERSKQHLLRKGPFGSVFAEIRYFYAPIYRNQPSELLTVPYGNASDHDSPSITSVKPLERCQHIDGLSMVRIFEHAPGYLIVSANYSPAGDLYSLRVNGSRNGDWVHQNVVDAFANGQFSTHADNANTGSYFGLPLSISAEMLRDPDAVSWPVAVLQSHLDLLYRHYDQSRCVREDTYRSGKLTDTRWLVFAVTPSDTLLQTIDGRRAFNQRAVH